MQDANENIGLVIFSQRLSWDRCAIVSRMDLLIGVVQVGERVTFLDSVGFDDDVLDFGVHL